MAEPVGGRLSEAFRRTYEQAGINQHAIARALDVDQPTVSKWARGMRRPPLDALPVTEQLAGVPKGTILRLAGYVDESTDTLTVIASDPVLDDDGRQAMTALYRVLTRGDTRPIPDPNDADEMAIWAKTTYSEAERTRLIVEGLREPRSRPPSKRRTRRNAS